MRDDLHDGKQATNVIHYGHRILNQDLASASIARQREEHESTHTRRLYARIQSRSAG